jgi:integrase/recombinase XerD
MLTPYRRHKKHCPHRARGRAYRRCSCPIWVDGVFDGAEIRQSLKVHTWEDADRELEKLKRRLTDGSLPADGPVTIERAWDDFISDAEARNLRDESLRKYKYLRTDMERFAKTAGLRFVREFDLEQLRKWRSTWPNKNLSAVKKLEFVRCFLRFSHDAGWIPDNPARKLKSPKVTAHPTLPFSRAQMVQVLAATDDYGKARLSESPPHEGPGALAALLWATDRRRRDAVFRTHRWRQTFFVHLQSRHSSLLPASALRCHGTRCCD